MTQDQLNKIRLAAGLAPVFKREEREHLEEQSRKNASKNEALNEAANNRAPGTVLAQIARQHLGIRNLKAQNSDSLDFHEVSVWGVEAALKAAFKAGQDSAPKAVKEGDESKAEVKKVGTEYDPKGGERYPVADKSDPDTKYPVAKGKKKGKSAENYKTPTNKKAKQVTEAKAKKDYDGDGKVESSEDEHKGAKNKAIKLAMQKNKETGDSQNQAAKEMNASMDAHDRDVARDIAAKKVVKEMDLELDMGDDEGMGDMKSRRMGLIRKAAQRVRGGEDMVDVGDEEMGDDEGGINWPKEQQTDAEYEDQMNADEDEMSGEMNFGGDMGDVEWEDEEDIGCACSEFQPENEEEFATGYRAFTGGAPADGAMGSDFKNGYETARFSRMSSVAEGRSEGYQNPKGKKGLNSIKGSNKTGADAKPGKVKSKKGKSEGYQNPKGKADLGKIKEGAQDATVLDKDYHFPVGANGNWDMAQHKDKPHVQDGGQMEKVKVPPALKKSLKEEIADLRNDAGKVRYRDELRAEFYENTAEVFEGLLHHLEEGTRHSLLLAQIDMNRVMSPMTHRLPRDVFMYIVRGGKSASLTELFKEVKVKDGGADPSKEDYNK
jgi:hypothetical protein